MALLAVQTTQARHMCTVWVRPSINSLPLQSLTSMQALNSYYLHTSVFINDSIINHYGRGCEPVRYGLTIWMCVIPFFKHFSKWFRVAWKLSKIGIWWLFTLFIISKYVSNSSNIVWWEIFQHKVIFYIWKVWVNFLLKK